jgi:hypothetical protein
MFKKIASKFPGVFYYRGIGYDDVSFLLEYAQSTRKYGNQNNVLDYSF